MGDRCPRPRLVPHSHGPRPRSRSFHGRRQHTPPGFDGLIYAACLQELSGLSSTFPWTLQGPHCLRGPCRTTTSSVSTQYSHFSHSCHCGWCKDFLRGGSEPRLTTATGCEPGRHQEWRPATST
ncbi:hypothetical protein MRX96_055527 [Rhipicephalus microplus]